MKKTAAFTEPFLQLLALLFGVVLMALMACNKTNQPTANQSLAFVKYFGDSATQAGIDVRQTSDSGYVVVGNTRSFGAGEEDIYLIKTDTEGNESWSTTFGTALADSAAKIIINTSGEFVIVGTSTIQSELTGNLITKIRFIHVDAQGVEISNTLLREVSSSNETAVSIIEAPAAQGGYLIVGYTDNVLTSKPFYDPTTDLLDLYIAKVDATGTIEWERVYGFPYEDYGVGAVNTTSGDYLVLGRGTILHTDNVVRGSFIAYLLDPDGGNVAGQDNYPIDGLDITEMAACQTAAGEIVLAGLTSSSYILTSIDETLNPLNSYTVTLTNPVTGKLAIEEIPNTGYAIVGTRNVATRDTDILLARTDYAGTLIGETVFGTTGSKDVGRSVRVLSSGFILAGTADVGTNTMTCIIRTNASGLLQP